MKNRIFVLLIISFCINSLAYGQSEAGNDAGKEDPAEKAYLNRFAKEEGQLAIKDEKTEAVYFDSPLNIINPAQASMYKSALGMVVIGAFDSHDWIEAETPSEDEPAFEVYDFNASSWQAVLFSPITKNVNMGFKIEKGSGEVEVESADFKDTSSSFSYFNLQFESVGVIITSKQNNNFVQALSFESNSMTQIGSSSASVLSYSTLEASVLYLDGLKEYGLGVIFQQKEDNGKYPSLLNVEEPLTVYAHHRTISDGLELGVRGRLLMWEGVEVGDEDDYDDQFEVGFRVKKDGNFIDFTYKSEKSSEFENNPNFVAVNNLTIGFDYKDKNGNISSLSISAESGSEDKKEGLVDYEAKVISYEIYLGFGASL